MDCIQHNGNITGYSILIELKGKSSSNKTNITVWGGSNGGKYDIMQLIPSTTYSIEVAAVNSAGIGVYSSPLIVLTLPPHICASELEVPLYPGSKIVYNWTQAEAGSLQRQECPNTCQDFISYPTGAVLERECRQEESRAVWQDVNVDMCSFSLSAVQLCEKFKVSKNQMNQNYTMEVVIVVIYD